MTTEIVQAQSPAEILRYAIENKAPLEQIEKFLLIKERYEENEARKAYHVAMSAFKADPPKIKKDKKVGYNTEKGHVGYSHASLGNVADSINPGLSKQGLSVSWTVTQKGNEISVTTKITHKLGHSEETTLMATADKSGAKNDIQAMGSAITYLERYGLLALTGLATYDVDDDGRAGRGTEVISEKEYSLLLDHINNEGLKEEAVCRHLKIDSLKNLPKKDYQRAMNIKKAASR